MKILMLTLFMVVLAVPLTGQNGVGLAIGANISNTSTKDESRVGFHAGFLKRFGFHPSFYGQTELQYSQKGFKAEKTINNVDVDMEVRYDYLSTVFILGYKATDNLSLQLGGEGGYLINTQTKFNGESDSNFDQFSDFDFSLVGGVQFQFNRVGLYARYSFSFADMLDFRITDINGNTVDLHEVGKHRTFQVGASFMFSPQI